MSNNLVSALIQLHGTSKSAESTAGSSLEYLNVPTTLTFENFKECCRIVDAPPPVAHDLPASAAHGDTDTPEAATHVACNLTK